MSNKHKQAFSDIRRAIERVEEILESMESERLFSIGEDVHPSDSIDDLDSGGVERLDLDTIDDLATELETTLDTIADELTAVIEPDADEALSIDEILARYVRQGQVPEDAVVTAAKLIECLGTSGSVPGQGLSIGEIGYAPLEELHQSLDELVAYLESQARP